MTTVFRDEKTCPVCGSKVEVSIIGSTNTLGGSVDLDTRPPEMMRSTIYYWIEVCPECGFVSRDMNDADPVDNAILESERYKNCDGYDFKGDLQKNFYREYIIRKCGNDSEGVLLSLLHTTWACDDKEDECAKEIRSLLVNEIEAIDEDVDETWEVIKADLLRRSEQFEKLKAEYALKKYDQEILNTIIKYELILAEEGDADCHTFEDAQSRLEK